MASVAPIAMHKYLSVIQHWEGENVIIGASNLCGRFWSGSIWCFPTASDAPDVEKCITGAEVEAGVCDALTISSKNIMVALDSGAVEIFELQSDPSIFDSKFYSCEHDDVVSSLSINSDATQVVSSSYDKCIKVWDLESMATVATYRPAHANIVWKVACCPMDPNVFISCGQDYKTLMWDLRLPKPATMLGRTPGKVVPTSVAWQPQSLTAYAIGDETGRVVLRDIREDVEPICEQKMLNRRVHKLSFSPMSPSWLAACGDETRVVIMDCGKDKGDVIYQNDEHDDFVQGLSWGPNNKLYSCGWDQRVLTHHIATNNSMEQT